MGPNGQPIELLKWKSKFIAEIMDLCLVEIVQIEGMTLPYDEQPINNTDEAPSPIQKLNMYIVLFKRPDNHEDTMESIELFNNIYQATLAGLT